MLLFFFFFAFFLELQSTGTKRNPECEERLESCVIVCLPIGWCGVAEFVSSSQPPHELLHFVVLTLFALFGNVCMHCIYIWPLAQVQIFNKLTSLFFFCAQCIVPLSKRLTEAGQPCLVRVVCQLRSPFVCLFVCLHLQGLRYLVWL